MVSEFLAAPRAAPGGPLPPGRSWPASLSLVFRRDARRTTLAERRHEGPLGVQQPFYPEDDGTCHVYVLHPPGGVAAGDALSIAATVGRDARALLTMPAATKLYRAGDRSERASLTQVLKAEPGAMLEWLPQETIAFTGSHTALTTRVELAGDAAFIGWEVLCLGRPAAGERFETGELRQRFEVHRDGAPLFVERTRFEGGSPVLTEPFGLAGCPVVGTMVCVTRVVPALVDALRKQLAGCTPDTHAADTGSPASERFAVSQLRDVLVCRYVGTRADRALAGFRTAWETLRAQVHGRAATTPRIWLT